MGNRALKFRNEFYGVLCGFYAAPLAALVCIYLILPRDLRKRIMRHSMVDIDGTFEHEKNKSLGFSLLFNTLTLYHILDTYI